MTTHHDEVPDLDRLRTRAVPHQPTARRVYAGSYLLGTITKLRMPTVGRRSAWRWYVRPAPFAWQGGQVEDSMRGDAPLAQLGPFERQVDAELALVVHLRTHRATAVEVLYGGEVGR
jgi:hypothetical protein